MVDQSNADTIDEVAASVMQREGVDSAGAYRIVAMIYRDAALKNRTYAEACLKKVPYPVKVN